MKQSPSKPGLIYLLPPVFFAFVGMFLVLYSTGWGAGLISDSFQYVAGARNFVAGNGFSIPYGDGQLEPMTKYPPMYSLLLAMLEFDGLSTLQNARFMNMILFGVNILLVFVSAQRLTRSFYFSLLASALFSVSFVLIEAHSWLLSEPLYICLALVSILILDRYFSEAQRRWLVMAAVFVAGAIQTRYVGLSLAAAMIVVLLPGRSPGIQKLADSLLFGVLALLPFAAWTARGYALTQTLNDRIPGFHPLTVKNIVSAMHVVFGWFLPLPLVQGNEKLLLIFSSVLVIGAAVYFLKFHRRLPLDTIAEISPRNRIITLHIIYVFAYAATIVVSKTWVDPDIGLSDRILSPALVSLLILCAVLFSFIWDHFARLRIIVAALSLGLLAYYSTVTLVGVQRFHEMGIGIARRGWHRSEVLQSVRDYSGVSIYTNSNSSLYLWSDRAGYGIKDFEFLKQTGTDKTVLLVLFRHVPPGGKRLDQLVQGLDLLGEDQIISIYSLEPKQQ
ncbi:MAG TPA: hypothetical protein VI524_06560 [Anaerolineales bacterium]|nr:hypothetical protein [Anaerolineales bacterium]